MRRDFKHFAIGYYIVSFYINSVFLKIFRSILNYLHFTPFYYILVLKQ